MIVTQEELITSFFIFSHLKYSPEIKRRHPGAKKWSEWNCCKYFVDFYVMDMSDKYLHRIHLQNAPCKHTEYVVAHCSRLLDGLLFLFINTCVMLLQINDVLGLFLNFAALMWDLYLFFGFGLQAYFFSTFYLLAFIMGSMLTLCICHQVFTNNRQYCITSLLRWVLDTIINGISARCCRYEVCCKAPLQSQLYADILCGIGMVWPRCNMGMCSLEE